LWPFLRKIKAMTEEEEAILYLKQMKPAQLDVTPYDCVWWLCCYKGCNNGTRVRDYGIAPEYWKKQYGFFNPNERFILCAEHWKFYKRLSQQYSREHIDRHIFEIGKVYVITNEERIERRNRRPKNKASQKIHGRLNKKK
jgi:hypothetical protein